MEVSNIEAVIFDLDGTLYDARHAGVWEQMDANASLFISRYMQIDTSAAREISRNLVAKYGSTVTGLLSEEKDFDPEVLVPHLHDIDLSGISPNGKLRQLLTQARVGKYIFTNGSRSYAKAVLDRLWIAECFDGIFDIRLANYRGKPALCSFATLLGTFGLDATRCIMIDDVGANLAVAKFLGMRTVQVVGCGAPYANGSADLEVVDAVAALELLLALCPSIRAWTPAQSCENSAIRENCEQRP